MAKDDFILERFVALDLETTGFDAARDDVIEIGVVKVEWGEVTQVFEQFVFTDKEIPYAVRQLTGISKKDLDGKPELSEVLVGLDEFIGDLPLVAHNAQFDVGFLKSKGYEVRGRVYDTLSISRIAVPRAVNHRLETLLKGFQIPSDVSHRAAADASGVARLFLALCDYLISMRPALLRSISRMIGDSSWTEKEIFAAAEKFALKSALVKSDRPQFLKECTNIYRNIFGEGKLKAVEEKTLLSEDSAADYFKEGGILSGTLSGFEHRAEQVSMSKSCVRSFNEAGFLAAEAGTGTGKSLAYLLPALLWSDSNGERVVISTNTKNLQDQLFNKDIPLLSGAIPFDFRATLLKGRRNYICRTKWDSIVSEPEQNLNSEERIGALPLFVWLEETETGDLSECTGFRAKENPALYNAIGCEWNYCLKKNCTFRSKCFLNRVRDAATDSNLVIVNHSLLLSDLVAKSRAVGTYTRLIIDEAHNLEDAATENMGRKASLARIGGILDRISPERGYGGGLLGQLGRLVRDKKSALSKSIDSLKTVTSDTRKSAQTFFQDLYRMTTARSEFGKGRYAAGDERIGAVMPDGLELATKLNQLKDGLAGIAAWVKSGEKFEGGRFEEVLESISARQVDLLEAAADLEFLVRAEDESHCYWTEIYGKDENAVCEMKSAPIDVGKTLCETLYDNLDSCIFTSATLTVATSFDFFLERNGITRCASERLRTLMLGSPFDFPEQSRAVLAAYLPSPSSPDYTSAVARLIESVILGTRRGTLVLLTSYSMLNDLSSKLSRKLEENGITLLVQGESGSRTRILEEFKLDRSSVVFGTDSFWEGVDVPGKSLEIVVIGKLPFPVPNEPITQARTQALERESVDAFSSYMVPRAVIKFRQGIGRLIRNKTDRGIVLIVDPRAGSASYGDLFLNSVPVEVQFCSTAQQVLHEIESFWRRDDEEGNKKAP